MVELRKDSLVFSFPEVHPQAKLVVGFQRTFRIPDDGRSYPLPPGLGRFPLRHVDDFSGSVPRVWLAHGGIMLPMYQSEALWLHFDSALLPDVEDSYPFAIKVATGKINAVTGEAWCEGLQRGPQDYLVAPPQPWLDGYCVAKGVIRQFVAVPLGAGYTAEEQITGRPDIGGLQLMVYPLKRTAFEHRFRRRKRAVWSSKADFCVGMPDMGLAPGGKMKQHLYKDRHALGDWDQDQHSRCFVHIANSLVWRAMTDQEPPTTPLTAREYEQAGLPWFDYYDDRATPLDGAAVLNQLKSLMSGGAAPIPENESVEPRRVITLQPRRVREGVF